MIFLCCGDLAVKTCCFIGHRKIKEAEALKEKLYKIVENLIIEKEVEIFLFGSKSKFNDLCYAVAAKLKEKHPNIKRVYVRAEYPEISDAYESYLLEDFEQTYYPECAEHAGKAAYIKRNFEMIDKSDFCVFYYKEKQSKGGTKIAWDYAMKRKKCVINTFFE